MSTRVSGFAGMRQIARAATVAAVLTGSLAACSSDKEKEAQAVAEPPPPRFIGAVVADEPQAAEIGRAILRQGGTAADAAAAIGYALSVTLPSRASLGASGACLAYDPAPQSAGHGVPEAIIFAPTAPANPNSADRPASVPLLARGLYLLQARYGALQPPQILQPAEDLARGKATVSKQLAADLALVAGPLSGDPAVRAIFYNGERPLGVGARLSQPQLAETLARIRMVGIGDVRNGAIARSLADDMARAGGGLTLADIQAANLSFNAAWLVEAQGYAEIALLPATERGAVATAAAAQSLLDSPNDIEAAYRRSLAVAAAARQGDANNAALLDSKLSGGAVGPLPASTTFGALDAGGRAVVCGTSLGNLFGTGRIAANTGILLAVSAARAPAPLQSLAILVNRSDRVFFGLAGGSGQEGAPIAAAAALYQGQFGKTQIATPEPGRANVIACGKGLPGGAPSCVWSADPRGNGAALGVTTGAN